MPSFRKSSATRTHFFKGQHRYEHWYRDNTVYFITARCRGRYPAFADERAKAVFWDRFELYTLNHGFVPWVTSLMDNHYHVLGYLKSKDQLGPMMRKLHGSVAKLVNDLLPERRLPFWVDAGHQDYFDGCIRDELQCRRAYRYTQIQGVRHGICRAGQSYPHTRMTLSLEDALLFAQRSRVYLESVPYQRYQRRERTS